MSTTQVHLAAAKTIVIEPLMRTSDGPFTTVTVREEGLVLFVSSSGESIPRARALAAALLAACDAVQVVPIASLAPDLPEPVSPDLFEPTPLPPAA